MSDLSQQILTGSAICALAWSPQILGLRSLRTEVHNLDWIGHNICASCLSILVKLKFKLKNTKSQQYYLNISELSELGSFWPNGNRHFASPPISSSRGSQSVARQTVSAKIGRIRTGKDEIRWKSCRTNTTTSRALETHASCDAASDASLHGLCMVCGTSRNISSAFCNLTWFCLAAMPGRKVLDFGFKRWSFCTFMLYHVLSWYIISYSDTLNWTVPISAITEFRFGCPKLNMASMACKSQSQRSPSTWICSLQCKEAPHK